MVAYPMKYVLMIMVEYPISIKNDETPLILLKNEFFYNRVCREHVDILEKNHFSGLKIILVSFGARKYVVVDRNVKVPMKLIYKNNFPQYNYL